MLARNLVVHTITCVRLEMRNYNLYRVNNTRTPINYGQYKRKSQNQSSCCKNLLSISGNASGIIS